MKMSKIKFLLITLAFRFNSSEIQVNMYYIRFITAFVLYLVVSGAHGQIIVKDDSGRVLVLDRPASKVISLAPHVTELLYVAGADKQISGTVSFSDYPSAAKKIPLVGTYNKFDLESIVAINPDLILAWQTGNPEEQVNELIKLGFNVFLSEPKSLEDIASNITRIGKLLGTSRIADKQANSFISELTHLRENYSSKKKVSVFYEVWNRPLLSVNGQHLISHVIELCGGENVFSNLNTFVPQVNIEAVIDKNPDVIIIGMNRERKNWLDEWQQWQALTAVKNNHIYSIDADLIVRHTPRILIGAGQLCGFLDEVRMK